LTSRRYADEAGSGNRQASGYRSGIGDSHTT